MNLHQQINDSLCWAGVSQSVLEYYGVTKSQSDIRAYATNGNNVMIQLFGSQNPNRKGINQILSHFGNPSIASTGVWDSITFDAVKSQINFDKPVIALLLYYEVLTGEYLPTGHYVTIMGYDNTAIRYLDPDNYLTNGDIWENYNTFDFDKHYDDAYYDKNYNTTSDLWREWWGTLTLTTPPPYQPAVVGNIGTMSKIIPAITIINSLLLKPYH
jgi:hypothetical protein